MIIYSAPLAIGNAVLLLLRPPAGATLWRVLRKATNDIAHVNDPAATIAYDGDQRSCIDTSALPNGRPAFYQPFYLTGTAWSTAPAQCVTPQASFVDISVDVVGLIRDRLDAGMQVYVDRHAIAHPLGHVPVTLGSPAFEDVHFPALTVHLVSDVIAERFVGEGIHDDVRDGEEVASFEGWLSRYQVMIGVWSKNGDVRAAMRKAVKAIILGNLSVFEMAGLQQVDVAFNDQDDMATYNAPIYQSICTFQCLAASAIASRAPAITDFDVIASPIK